MPQLDKVSFLSQFFWLCFFYLGFYYIVLKYFLPKMARILKLRKKKMNLSLEGISSLQQENKQINLSYENILSKGLNISKSNFNQGFIHITAWLNNIIQSLNKTQYLSLNKIYIHSIGESSLSQNLTLYHTAKNYPEKLILKLIADKIKKKFSGSHTLGVQLSDSSKKKK
jgi:hypothetical protein